MNVLALSIKAPANHYRQSRGLMRLIEQPDADPLEFTYKVAVDFVYYPFVTL